MFKGLKTSSITTRSPEPTYLPPHSDPVKQKVNEN